MTPSRRTRPVQAPAGRANAAPALSAATPLTSYVALEQAWSAAWPIALAAWSPFTRLRPPVFCKTDEQAETEGLTGSFAMIRLVDQAVVISFPEVERSGVGQLPVEILAHEIGHHVLAPATLTDHARIISRMRWSLPSVESSAPMVANLYTDLLINDRLQRSAGLRMAEVYRALARDSAPSPLWLVYLRIYEILWSLSRGSLGGNSGDDQSEGDAWLGSRLVRSYASDYVNGSGRFAALMLPYLLKEKKSTTLLERWFDTRDAAAGGHAVGVSEIEPGEREGAIHPAHDASLNDLESEADPPEPVQAQPLEASRPAGLCGQTRQPFEYGELLRGAGLVLSDHEVAIRYYRERALPHLVPFPSRPAPSGTDPLPEGLEPWDIGQPLDDVDWLQSVLVSPRPIPGMTTVQRVWGTSPGRSPSLQPLDLDLYVDSSGSMANPQQVISYPALAGAIICLSALRAGARVQATLWSGKREFITTNGFVQNEHAILEVLTGYLGGATAFPIHILRDTFVARTAASRPAHIMVISDDGVSTMFDDDEKKNSGWVVAAMALSRGRAGGTLVLSLPAGWEKVARRPAAAPFAAILRARDEQGWDVSRVASWDDLVTFARQFSKRRFGSLATVPKTNGDRWS